MQAFGDGFDLYAALGDMGLSYWDTATGLNAIVTGRFTGSRGVSFVNNGGTNLVKSSGANDAVHHIVFAVWTANTISGSTLQTFFQLLDGTTGQCAIVFRSDGALLLTSGSPAGTVLDTYTGAMTATSTWTAFEVEVVINSTTGSWAVRKNGNTVNDHALSGLNTRVSANNYANKLQVGMQGATGNGNNAIDDLLWRSDPTAVPWVGDIRCYTRMPASDAQKVWTPNSGTTNYSRVSEAQEDGATSYVYDANVGAADFYGIAALSGTPGSVICVTTRGLFEKSDAGTRSAAVQIKSGTATVASTSTALATGWGWLWRTDLNDPNTGATWTATAVNNAQVGPTVTA